MSVLIGVAVLFLGAGFFTRQAGSLRNHAWAGPRTQAQRGRGAQKQRSVRQEVKLAWTKVQAADWLEQQRHHRKNGGQSQGGTPAAVGAARAPTPLQRAYASVRSRSGRNTATGNGTQGTVIPPAAQSRPTAPPQAPQVPPQHVNTSSNGRTSTVASNSSAGVAEDLFHALDTLRQQASAGNKIVKHNVIKTLNEMSLRAASTVAMIARDMSEPTSNYGPECTEPVEKASEYFQGAGTTLAEADTAMTTLGHMTVDELAESPRRAPHPTELSENGSK